MVHNFQVLDVGTDRAFTYLFYFYLARMEYYLPIIPPCLLPPYQPCACTCLVPVLRGGSEVRSMFIYLINIKKHKRFYLYKKKQVLKNKMTCLKKNIFYATLVTYQVFYINSSEWNWYGLNFLLSFRKKWKSISIW